MFVKLTGLHKLSNLIFQNTYTETTPLKYHFLVELQLVFLERFHCIFAHEFHVVIKNCHHPLS